MARWAACRNGFTQRDWKFHQTQKRDGSFAVPLLFGSELFARGQNLDNLNVLSLPAFRPLRYSKLNPLAFLQGAEAARTDGRKMHEDVFVVALAGDEPESLGVIKPLNCSLFHDDALVPCCRIC